MRWVQLGFLMLSAGAALIVAEPGSSDRGRQLFDRRCGGCHALDRSKTGPALQGVFGRKAASGKFPYSTALSNARIVWDDATLDRWLADPEALVPDNDMAFRMDRADERAAVIAYLKQLAVSNDQH